MDAPGTWASHFKPLYVHAPPPHFAFLRLFMDTFWLPSPFPIPLHSKGWFLIGYNPLGILSQPPCPPAPPGPPLFATFWAHFSTYLYSFDSCMYIHHSYASIEFLATFFVSNQLPKGAWGTHHLLWEPDPQQVYKAPPTLSTLLGW